MSCKTCGHAVELVKESGGTVEGTFEEEYRCTQGHLGWVRGEASAPAEEWDRTGSVFNEL